MKPLEKITNYLVNNLGTISKTLGSAAIATIIGLTANYCIREPSEMDVLTGTPQSIVTDQFRPQNKILVEEYCGTLTIAKSRSTSNKYEIDLLVQKAINNQEIINLHGRRCERTNNFNYKVIETNTHILDARRYTSLRNNDGSRTIAKEELYKKKHYLFE